MGLKKFAKKQLGKAVARSKRRVKIAGPFVPGLGTVVDGIDKAYQGLNKADKAKFHKAKGKSAKMRVLKSKKR